MQARYISLVCHARGNSNDVIALAINIPRQIEETRRKGTREGEVKKNKKERKKKYGKVYERPGLEERFENGLLFHPCPIIGGKDQRLFDTVARDLSRGNVIE